ncbi:helix-turn-helix domain-containing protein [Streptomyces pratens]|uniref:Helix-turn-helix domain-containing protein n=1 Tax=Streptomyces pratens TaxID=887456 RepID=A0ABW1MA21_9ACTN
MTRVPEQAVARRSEDPADELLRSFGRQIKILREQAGHTQAALAQLLGYSETQALSPTESGHLIEQLLRGDL